MNERLSTDIDEILSLHGTGWTEEDKFAVKMAAAHLMTLMARKSMGEKVDEEIAVVAAASENIAVAATMTGKRMLTLWLQRAMSLVVGMVLRA